MGFGDVVGPMVSLAKQTFTLSNFMAELLPFSGFILFGLLSVPLGILQARVGKKRILLSGLLIALGGLLIPILAGMYGARLTISSGEAMKFYVLLLSILLLGAGATALQVVGNPIMRDVSPAGTYSQNLSLAQAVKAIGSSLGFLLPPIAMAAFGFDWPILFPVYAAIVALTLLLSFSLQAPAAQETQNAAPNLRSCLSLFLDNSLVFKMTLGIFVYVGAEVCLSSGVPLLLKSKFGIMGFTLWTSWALFFLPILIGRFAGAAILRKIKPRKFLILTTALSILGILCTFGKSEIQIFTGIVLTSLGFANIFPLIFSITIDAHPQQSDEISGLMVTAIVGGAIIPPLMGLVADATHSIQTGFVVPLVAIVYIAWVAVSHLKTALPIEITAA